mgnify:CR=1 FL=1
MKPAGKPSQVLFSLAWTGLTLFLLAGCSATSSQKKVYDRYAARVAELNRQPKPVSAAPAAASRPAAKPSESSDRRPVKSPAAEKPAPAKAPPAAPVAPPVAAPVAVKSEPVPAPPVQVIAPPPVAKIEAKPVAPPSVPVPPAPAAPVAPAPVETPAAPVMPAAPVPAPVAIPVAPAPSLPPEAASAATSEDAPFAADSVAYTLKQGDVVQVFLRGIPSAEAIEGVVDENGMISMPFINEVRAAGQSASELARNIRQIYMDRGIYRNISVTVVVPTRYFFVQGEIRGPGRFQMLSATRVSQAIAGAGGYTEYASGQVLVKRGGKVVKTIKNSRRLERTPEDDILLEPDDIIEVKRSLW